MDVCQNVSVPSECKQENSTFSTSLDDLFSAQNTEVDVGMEWLSVFVEDCFSSPPSFFLGHTNVQTTSTSTNTNTIKLSSSTKKRPQQNESSSSLQNFSVPGKARSKRKRLSAPRTKDPSSRSSSMWSHKIITQQNESFCSDPPLLKQAYWLADSELIVTKQNKDEDEDEDNDDEQEEGVTKDGEVVMMEKGIVMRKESFGFEELSEADYVSNNNNNNNGQHNPVPRRCTHCLSQRTPQWRAGPLGPKTLCNACGVRYKSGRLLPEYRPAKSPTFVSYLHSNSHKKVMEMRMSVLSSIPSEQ
ncbi:hypothetical protein RIF29_05164 [Crotalaria pallida]|uniref:GATA-type domain-containing protein n=1 Tax=Crotalaria pallida TaxID=3830 RepID=A0AAN9P9M3_CROPI